MKNPLIIPRCEPREEGVRHSWGHTTLCYWWCWHYMPYPGLFCETIVSWVSPSFQNVLTKFNIFNHKYWPARARHKGTVEWDPDYSTSWNLKGFGRKQPETDLSIGDRRNSVYAWTLKVWERKGRVGRAKHFDEKGPPVPTGGPFSLLCFALSILPFLSHTFRVQA